MGADLTIEISSLKVNKGRGRDTSHIFLEDCPQRQITTGTLDESLHFKRKLNDGLKSKEIFVYDYVLLGVT